MVDTCGAMAVKQLGKLQKYVKSIINIRYRCYLYELPPKELTTFYIRYRRSALANRSLRDCNRTLPQTKHEDLIERNTPPLCKPESLLVCVHPRRCTVKIYRPAKLPKVHLASSVYVVVFASCLGHGHCHHTPSNSHRFEHVYHASPSKVVQDLGISVMYQ